MEKQEIKQEIQDVAELFYQQKNTEGYQRLNQLLQDLSAYVGTITEEEQQMEFLEALKEALDAMEQKDTTLLADILQYELIEKL
ncbi:MAG: hypothetical protein PUC39_00825 [Lachnospiraceae bacterium]|nr:hypothetical protein [Lachnospiraceae bacterium]